MQIANPYLEEKHNLVRLQEQNPTPETAEKIQQLEYKSRAFVQEQINNFDSQIETIREKSNSVSKDYQSKRQQYLRLIQLYREAMKVAKEISQTKKEMREE
jgi:DNA-binding ferritin-like protein